MTVGSRFRSRWASVARLSSAQARTNFWRVLDVARKNLDDARPLAAIPREEGEGSHDMLVRQLLEQIHGAKRDEPIAIPSQPPPCPDLSRREREPAPTALRIDGLCPTEARAAFVIDAGSLRFEISCARPWLLAGRDDTRARRSIRLKTVSVKIARRVKRGGARRDRLRRVRIETRSFYETAVERAVMRIRDTLDEALDLATLAKNAALSPFHFHRVFRGMVGETPLEMHRRLRLERAARQLLDTDTTVTAIAFRAGYETHEAFTRAFRQAYGASPLGFRQVTAEPRPSCVRPRQIELAAPSGIHFHEMAGENPIISFIEGETIMEVTLENMPELRVATVHHVGPYQRISEAFQRVGAIAGPAGLLKFPEAAMLAIYYDDPEATPADQLQSDAGIAVPKGVPLPEGLVEKKLPAGRYARTTHIGPYTRLGDTWSRFMGEWLPKSGLRVGEGSSYEVYRNNPTNTPPAELRTDLYLPIA